MPTILSIRCSNTGTLHSIQDHQSMETKDCIKCNLMKLTYLEYGWVTQNLWKSNSVAPASIASTSIRGVITSLTCVSFISNTFSIISCSIDNRYRIFQVVTLSAMQHRRLILLRNFAFIQNEIQCCNGKIDIRRQYI